MLIVALAYLYVIGIVAVVSIVGGHVISGVFTLVFAGILPSVLWLTILRRKRLNAVAREQEDNTGGLPSDSSASYSASSGADDTQAVPALEDCSVAADTGDAGSCDASDGGTRSD